MSKQIKIFGIVTTKMQLFNAFWQNYIYGFLAGCLPTVVSLKNDAGIIISAILYYGFLSIVLNRPPYKTKLGRFIIFPGSCAVGFYMGYKLINILIQ